MLLVVLLLVVASGALGVWAQNAVRGRAEEWGEVAAGHGLSGAEVARRVMRAGGVEDVAVEPVSGRLRDHYDPAGRRLRLSQEVHDRCSVAAMGVAAHEAGHALQHASGYGPLALRSLAVPSAMLGNLVGLPMLLVGALTANPVLAALGLLFFAGVVAFQLITLPVELDASRRALAALEGLGMVAGEEEGRGVRAVLNAAALTYVAAALSGIAVLLYYGLLLFGRRG